MVQYIIQIIAFQVFFLFVYDVFFKKETFFNWNRVYLIGTSLMSLILPFIKVRAFKEIVPKDYIVALPEIFLGNKVEQSNQVVLPEIEITSQAYSWSLETLFYIGVAIASLLFVFKIAHIFLLIYRNPKRWKGNIILVKLINSTSAFSFFHYVFLGSNLKENEQKVIIKHELVHVTQKHTLDLLFFEVQRILFWFNPLVYMYQARIRSLHEFIADQEAIKTQDKSDYYQNLLTQVFDTQNVSFISTFFKKSLIKKRIIMLSKSKSKQAVKLKYILLIPVIFGMLVYTSCAQEARNIEKTENIQQSKTDSSVLLKIEDLKDAIAKQGNITKEEEKSLKTLMMLVTKDGLNNPFFTDVVDRAEIPFEVIENVPVYIGCESLESNEDRRKCMANEITKHVLNNFNADLAHDLKLSGRQRINVIFKINKNGEITDVKSRAPHPKLEEEANRVISLLPKMKPGIQDGKPVAVPYSLPIIFEVSDKKKN